MVVRQICGNNVSASKKKHKLLLSYVHYSATLNLTSWRLVLLLPGRHGSCHHNHYIYIFPVVFQIVTSLGICCKIGQSVGSAIRFSKYLGSPPSQKEEGKKNLPLIGGSTVTFCGYVTVVSTAATIAFSVNKKSVKPKPGARKFSHSCCKFGILDT